MKNFEPTLEILKKISELENTKPEKLPKPLQEVIDVDALEKLAEEDNNVELKFTYLRYSIHIQPGEVQVTSS